jgi:hypothetical protein
LSRVSKLGLYKIHYSVRCANQLPWLDLPVGELVLGFNGE